MATYTETILPSGRGIRIQKLDTKQFRAVNDRAIVKVGGIDSPLFKTALPHELLMTALKAITREPVQVKTKKVMVKASDDTEAELEEIDVDAMCDSIFDPLKAADPSIPPTTGTVSWFYPTHFDLVAIDSPTNLETLLADPRDYMVAMNLVQDITFPGKPGALGKARTVSVERSPT